MQATTAVQIQCLAIDAVQRPLVAKFYRANGSKMSGARQQAVWVAKREHIIAALCLTPCDSGHWLTGLLVAPVHRSQGIASLLLSHVRQAYAGPIWLFARPELARFYQQHGYHPSTRLPAALAQRLTRYQQHKTLMAFEHPAA